MKTTHNILLFITGSVMLFSCSQGNTQQTNNQLLNHTEGKNMNVNELVIQKKIHVKKVFSFSWKEGELAIHPALLDRPLSAVSPGGKSLQQKFGPVSFNISGNGNIVVMDYSQNNGVTFLCQSTGSTHFNKIHFSSYTSISDFTITNDGKIVLIRTASEGGIIKDYLTMLDAKGTIVWNQDLKEVNDKLKAVKKSDEFSRLYSETDGTIYLGASLQNCLAPVDANTGKLQPEVKTDDTFFWPLTNIYNHTLYSTRYSKNAFFFQHADAASGKLSETSGNYDLKDYRYTAIGFDKSGNQYSYIYGNPATIQLFSPEVKTLGEIKMESVYYRSADAALFISYRISDTMVVEQAGDKPVFLNRFIIPDDIAKQKEATVKISSVDKDGSCKFIFTDGVDLVEEILIYGADGKLVKRSKVGEQRLSLESELQKDQIRVDSEGTLYLPVTDADGFKIIQCRFE